MGLALFVLFPPQQHALVIYPSFPHLTTSVSHILSFQTSTLSTFTNNSPFFHPTTVPKITDKTFKCQQSNLRKESQRWNNQWVEAAHRYRDNGCNIWRNESGTCRQSIGDTHQGSCIARCNVHMVHEISAEDKATDGNCQDEDGDCQSRLRTVNETQPNEADSWSNQA